MYGLIIKGPSKQTKKDVAAYGKLSSSELTCHPQENVSRCVDTFTDRRAHNRLQNPAELEKHPLHCAEVVEHRNAQAEEENCRKHGERKDLFVDDEKVAVNECSSCLGIFQKLRHFVSQALEDHPTDFPANTKNPKQELEQGPTKNRSPVYPFRVSCGTKVLLHFRDSLFCLSPENTNPTVINEKIPINDLNRLKSDLVS